MGNRERLEKEITSVLVFGGIAGILLCGPGLLVSLVPGVHDTLLGDNPIHRLGLAWIYEAGFGSVFLVSLVALLLGVRRMTRPPSLLYRLTHPRLPYRPGRSRGAWRLS